MTGWQYSTDTGTGNWSPQCLNIHTTRRRRWFRTRIKTSNGQVIVVNYYSNLIWYISFMLIYSQP
jgi:hypothetical protein